MYLEYLWTKRDTMLDPHQNPAFLVGVRHVTAINRSNSLSWYALQHEEIDNIEGPLGLLQLIDDAAILVCLSYEEDVCVSQAAMQRCPTPSSLVIEAGPSDSWVMHVTAPHTGRQATVGR